MLPVTEAPSTWHLLSQQLAGYTRQITAAAATVGVGASASPSLIAMETESEDAEAQEEATASEFRRLYTDCVTALLVCAQRSVQAAMTPTDEEQAAQEQAAARGNGPKAAVYPDTVVGELQRTGEAIQQLPLDRVNKVLVIDPVAALWHGVLAVNDDFHLSSL